MKMFNRNTPLLLILKRSWHILIAIYNAFKVFRNPLTIIYNYLKLSSPPNNFVETRDSIIIHLSSHPHDLTTAFIVFCRKIYGDINKNDVIIDVGANIGLFSLYAAKRGAKKIYAFEPNGEAYNCLLKNISDNNYENIIIPSRKAVSIESDDRVAFPIKSSPYNKILINTDGVEFDWVETISLDDIILKLIKKPIDLLKIDCEGDEIQALKACSETALSGVVNIRMDRHNYPLLLSELLFYLRINGFQGNYPDNDQGVIWLRKSNGLPQ